MKKIAIKIVASKYYISILYTYDLTLKIIWDKNLPVKERQECKKYICKSNLGIFILKLFILDFSKKTWHILERIQSSMFGITCILWSKLVRTLSYFWSIEDQLHPQASSDFCCCCLLSQQQIYISNFNGVMKKN